MAKEQQAFLMYHSFESSFLMLNDEDRGKLISAMFAYAKRGEEIGSDQPDTVRLAFSFVRDAIDRDRAHYAEVCKKNAKNGKKGGRPRKSTSACKAAPLQEDSLPEPAEDAFQKQDATEASPTAPLAAPKTERLFLEPKKANYNSNSNGNSNKNSNENSNFTLNSSGSSFTSSSEEVKPAALPAAAPKEKEELFACLRTANIPRAYLEARADRALDCAKRSRQTAAQLLTAWWEQDREEYGKHPHGAFVSKAPLVQFSTGSFDTDDFFEAALLHSARECGYEDVLTS